MLKIVFNVGRFDLQLLRDLPDRERIVSEHRDEISARHVAARDERIPILFRDLEFNISSAGHSLQTLETDPNCYRTGFNVLGLHIFNIVAATECWRHDKCATIGQNKSLPHRCIVFVVDRRSDSDEVPV